MPTSLAELLHYSSRRTFRSDLRRILARPTNLIGVTDTSPPTESTDEVDEIELLRETPVELILSNYIFHLIQLATVHLAASPAQLAPAQLTIDVVAAILKAGDDRLGENVALYRSALAEVQQVYVRAASVGH
jgi:hypothetical protein